MINQQDKIKRESHNEISMSIKFIKFLIYEPII